MTCKAILESGAQKGQVCGKKHHKSLHTEPKGNRNNRGKKSSQQTRENGDGNNASGPGGAQAAS